MAAELQPEAIAAYEAYVDQARRAFFSRNSSLVATMPACDAVMPARPGQGDGILNVPTALVHHWHSAAFVRGVTLRDALTVSRSYGMYSQMYREVIASAIVAQEGDTYRTVMRLKEGERGISAVLQIRASVEYVYPTATSVFAMSRSEEIREVKNAGERGERLLPAGQDSGYLWRANTLTHFLGQPDGVYVEMETIGLSRRFPPMLGWLVEPFARRLGRRSVERSLQQFAETVRLKAGLPAAGSPCD
jgi:hypothetical protein